MKKAILFMLSIGTLYAGEYFAKVEPIESYHIKSAVNGQVLSSDDSHEGQSGDGSVIVHIDDKIDKSNLKSLTTKFQTIKENIELSKDVIKNLQNSMRISYDSYNRVKNLSSYTRVQKDAKLSAYLSTKNAFLNAKINLQNLISQRDDLKAKITALKDTIEKKSITVKNSLYINKIYPKVGDFLRVGEMVVDAYDLSRGKITIFLSSDEVDEVKKRKIFIDGKETDYKISKIFKVADSKNISSYRCEIIIKPPKTFSKLVKVELQ